MKTRFVTEAPTRILIAEDDTTCRTVLAGVLKRQGHEVVETVNGADAWAVLQRPDAPRLAILDWLMPELDGLEVVRRVRAQPTARPPYLLMVTSKSDKADIIAGLGGGANDYLTKPFAAGELWARIQVGQRMVELQEALETKVTELRESLEHIKTLRGLIPICMYCKKIRDDTGYWDQVEVYVCKHTEAAFSHGICPGCLKTWHPDCVQDDDRNHTDA